MDHSKADKKIIFSFKLGVLLSLFLFMFINFYILKLFIINYLSISTKIAIPIIFRIFKIFIQVF